MKDTVEKKSGIPAEDMAELQKAVDNAVNGIRDRAAIDRAARETTRVEFGAGAATTVILIASRFERWKGHVDLLQAAATLTGDWTVWIAGAPQRSAGSSHQSLEKCGLATAVGADERH